MARRSKDRLTAIAVTKKKHPGMYADGAGLYLLVGPNSSKSWIFRFKPPGTKPKPGKKQVVSREMGLGSLGGCTLADARTRADDARRLLGRGIDPIDARDAERAAKAAENAAAVTFEEDARAYVEAHRAGWRSGKHSDQWINTLEAYAFPTAGPLLVQHVDTAIVEKILRPIWTTKATTAKRLRGRIEQVLDWATARGHRRGENPARWRGHLDKLLPRLKRRTRHHPSLPYADLPAFMVDLRAEEGDAARALELVIATVTRTTEAIAARVREIDFGKAIWTIPADRTKPHREYRVPLTAAALAILRPLCEDKNADDWIFPGRKRKRHMSNGAMLMLLERMKHGDITAHGFRSTFRDWAAERTNFPREIAEMALGHVVSDETEAAYLRSDMIERRRQLLDAWAKFAGSTRKAGDVVSINKPKRA